MVGTDINENPVPDMLTYKHKHRTYIIFLNKRRMPRDINKARNSYILRSDLKEKYMP